MTIKIHGKDCAFCLLYVSDDGDDHDFDCLLHAYDRAKDGPGESCPGPGEYDLVPVSGWKAEPPRSMKERAFRFSNMPTESLAMARGGAEDCPHGHVFPTASDTSASYWVCADCHAWITVPRPGGG